jgi:Ca2+-binding RTX toxin-like protein
VLRCHGLRATIVGTNQTEQLLGTPHDDVIVGRGGSDSIFGGGGDDVICGNAGADKIRGGPGNDRLYGGRDRYARSADGGLVRAGDLLDGGAGDDLLVPGVDRRPAAQIHRDIIDWNGARRGVTIRAGQGTAVGEGHDTFIGTGAWLLLSAHHDDVVYGSPGRDFVREVLAGDRVYGRGGNDVIASISPAGATVRGGAGDDTMQAGLASSQPSPTRMYGGSGRDRLTLSRYAGDPAETGLATWNMKTGAFRYTFAATTITLTAAGFEIGTPDTAHIEARWLVRGTDGNDRLSLANTAAGGTFHARAGDDAFRGSSADDIFDGGGGTDHSLGMGAGNDTCISVETYAVNDCEIQMP